MECVALDVESFHLGIGDFDALFVGCGVERAFDFQAGFGCGRGNQFDYGQAIGQGPRTPVLRDVAEHAMFDLVPLRRTWWIVMDVEHEARGVCELLQLDFP
jgi:hypothetical protein